ncbi:unnamed protein product [Meganyctiphanes norvegica]|uniref:Reverse transcriptase domain-containing protein n=1 Tax=Meganyctiphanes norvegica TaxID=48144 RepID=A0AAV2PKW5_MEGNR
MHIQIFIIATLIDILGFCYNIRVATTCAQNIRCTYTALLNYIEFLKNELTNYKYIISVFLELSKTFDVIDHKILEMKLEYYGFKRKFLEFLMSFIKDRKYFVHINGINSDTKSVNIGLPPGTTLGPHLFLIYINDMIYS